MALNPLKALLANQPGSTTPQDVSALKVESDILRRELMDKKQQILELEHQASKLDELSDLLKHLIQDFQAEGTIQFTEQENIQTPFVKIDDGIQLIRNAVTTFIKKHDTLANSFELEFQKALFPLKQQKTVLEDEITKARNKLTLAEDELAHKKSVVDILAQEKHLLMRTVLMKKDALARHITQHETIRSQLLDELTSANTRYDEAVSSSQMHEHEYQQLQQQAQQRSLSETQALESHQSIQETHTRYQKMLKDEAYAHNCTLAELDREKDELDRLFRALESYHDNLKTQELLQAEVENKRLRSVLKNEKAEAERKLAREQAKTKELEQEIVRVQESIDKLNIEIRQTEQKLQTQMMKIPDFTQLHQALDRTLAQTKRYKDEVLQRKYVLDEIRDKNRYIEMQEIQDSKKRMAALRLAMPMQSELKAESPLPVLSPERQDSETRLT